VTLTPVLDEHGPSAPELTASEAPHGGRSSLPAQLLRDPRRWARLRQAADLFAVAVGVVLALLVGPAARLPDLIAAGAFAVTAPILMYSRRSLGKQLGVGVLDSCARAVASCAIGAMVAIAVGVVAGSASPDLIGLRLWLLTVGVLCAIRTALGFTENRARARGLLMTPTLVVGAGAVGGWVVRRLEQQPSLGLNPIGFLDIDPDSASLDPATELPILGTPDEAVTVARLTGARQLVFAFSWERDHQLAGVVRRCQDAGLEVAIVPRLYETVNERASLDHVGGLPLMSFRPRGSQGWRFTIKYAIDRACAFVALVALAPLMLATAIAVKLSSPGPVIYRQRRVGLGGREFDLLKFRSMRTNERRAGFRPADGAAPGGIEGTDRRTPVGKWLRNTSLDELPQLFNVLRGEMSAIGPRPERPEFAARFTREVPGYDERHRVKPGITGWAQVNGLRGQTSIADRVEWDNHYIENWSIWLELRTLALTMAAVMVFDEERHAPSTADATDSAAPGTPPRLTPVPPPALHPVTTPDTGPAPTLRPVMTPDLQPATTSGFHPATNSGLRPVTTPDNTGPASQPAASPTLKLVDSAVPETTETHWFCGYCGTAANGALPSPMSRVCEHCAAGLLLEAPADVAPDCNDPFLVVDARLTVQAVSRRAEQIFGVVEAEVTDHPITELLIDADVEVDDSQSFAAALLSAALDDEGGRSTFVRPRDAYGIRIRARISHCGPPRAALIVLETPGPGSGPRLHLVRSEQPRAAQASA
jgi:exopolysaccharide biosynthesis polyprenyl glycosylphosphotransferase